MKSFKSFIIFIISIFITVILISECTGNKKESQKDNVVLFGYFLCKPCGDDDILMELYEKGQQMRVFWQSCRKYFFYVSIYSTSSNPNRFSASFTQYCNGTSKGKKWNVPAKYVEEINSQYYYTFGIVNLNNSEPENNLFKRE